MAIHRVIYGSLERFIGVIIEEFAGAFPVWLSPVQVKILPISDKMNDYAAGILKELKAAGIRVELDARSESVGKKIREAEMEKVPYMLIVGEKEVEAKTVAVRTRSASAHTGGETGNQQDMGAMDLLKFIAMIQEQIKSRSIK